MVETSEEKLLDTRKVEYAEIKFWDIVLFGENTFDMEQCKFREHIS
jgi:hypothetical protein